MIPVGSIRTRAWLALSLNGMGPAAERENWSNIIDSILDYIHSMVLTRGERGIPPNFVYTSQSFSGNKEGNRSELWILVVPPTEIYSHFSYLKADAIEIRKLLYSHLEMA